MSLRVYYEVLNQKGSPALFTDTLANRPAFGFQGRLFISTDSGQIFEDTGTAWTLVADAGVGGGTLSSVCLNGNTTATGIVITAGGLSSTTGTFSGIVTTPQVKASTSAGLSINANSGTQVADFGAGGSANITFFGGLSGTSASFSSSVTGNTIVKSGGTASQFLKADGSVDSNTYVTLGTTQTITGDKVFTNVINFNTFQTRFGSGIALNNTTSGGAVGSHTVIGANVSGLQVNLAAGGYNNLNFASTTVGNTYTFPNSTGTLALTTDLGSYLPLAGGTLTGALNGTSASFSSTIEEVLKLNTTAITTRIAFYNTNVEKARIYFNNSSNSLTYGTYNTGGSLRFEVDNNVAAMTISSGGQVGIGTTSPSQLLHIQKDQNTSTNLLIRNDSSGASAETYMNVSNGTYLTAIGTRGTGTAAFNALDTNSGILNYNGNTSLTINATDASAIIKFTTNNFTERMRITSGGNVLIGTTTDSGNKFQVNGTIDIVGNQASVSIQARDLSIKYAFYANDNSQLYLYNGSSNIGSFNATTGVYVALSDINKKKDLKESTIGLKEVLGLKPTLYRMKSDETEGNKELGFIAQEVKEFIPQAYVQNDDFIGLNYNAIVTALVKSVQELNEKIERL